MTHPKTQNDTQLEDESTRRDAAAEHGGARRHSRSDEGWTTAELLGNAALAILALVAIWGLLQALGVSVVGWIGGQLGI